MSDLPPSAAIVKAAKQIDCASSGNLWNSFSAALTQDIGRVVLVMRQLLHGRVTDVKYDNRQIAQQAAFWLWPEQSAYHQPLKERVPMLRPYDDTHAFRSRPRQPFAPLASCVRNS
jgi:hypothetical protein